MINFHENCQSQSDTFSKNEYFKISSNSETKKFASGLPQYLRNSIENLTQYKDKFVKEV